MKKNIILLIFLFTIINSYTQKANYYKHLFIDAEYFLLYEEFIDALPLYIEIFGVQQNNTNIACRIGECYLNIPNEKKKAITYLEKASKDISDDYKVGYYSEKKAPKEVFYLLGIAYRINNQLEEAIVALNNYKKLLADSENSKKKEADIQIEICNNAEELMKQPINVEINNMGKNINSSFANIKPSASYNDSVLVFTSQLRFYDAIFYTRWLGNKWIPASNITPYLGADGDINTCSVSPDGKTIFFSRNDWDNYNIYISHFINNTWQDIEKLDKPINTEYNETHACITKDGKTLYFVSDREGGFGGKDIYKSELDEEGNWGEPQNLGNIINTEKNEETPFVTKNGTLYFSSEGHYNIGGYDIFYSKKFGNSWEIPKNIGYPINTTDDNLNFAPIDNGKAAYYSLFRKDGFGDFDIFRIEF